MQKFRESSLPVSNPKPPQLILVSNNLPKVGRIWEVIAVINLPGQA